LLAPLGIRKTELLTDGVSGGTKDVDSAVEVGGLHEDVVGVEGGDGENADGGIGEGPGDGFEDAGERELEWAFDLEGAPIVVAGNVRRDEVAGGDDAEFVGSFSDGIEVATAGPGGDGGVRRKLADGEAIGEDGKIEFVHDRILILI